MKHKQLAVSIRSRVLSQEKLETFTSSSTPLKFQSAPGFYPRRNLSMHFARHCHRSFNPLPGSIPGETRLARSARLHGAVSIRSRVLSQEKRRALKPHIKSRRFNPLPGSIPGETRWRNSISSRSAFQSAPGFYPRRNVIDGEGEAVSCVSIRSRVLSQEKQYAPPRRLMSKVFQSAPGFYPRRNWAAAQKAFDESVSIRSRVLSQEKRSVLPDYHQITVSIRSRVLSQEKPVWQAGDGS